MPVQELKNSMSSIWHQCTYMHTQRRKLDCRHKLQKNSRLYSNTVALEEIISL